MYGSVYILSGGYLYLYIYMSIYLYLYLYLYGIVNKLSLIKHLPIRRRSPDKLLWLLSHSCKRTILKGLAKHSSKMIKTGSTPRKPTDGGSLSLKVEGNVEDVGPSSLWCPDIQQQEPQMGSAGSWRLRARCAQCGVSRAASRSESEKGEQDREVGPMEAPWFPAGIPYTNSGSPSRYCLLDPFPVKRTKIGFANLCRKSQPREIPGMVTVKPKLSDFQ